MTGKLMAPARWILTLALVVSTTGCMAAAAAAGAGAGIYLTTRGAESMVEGSIDDVSSRARAVLNEEGIIIDEADMKSGGEEREFKGQKGELDVTVDLRRESSTTTRVEVTARENVAEWDKEYAQQLLSRIIEKN